MVLGKDMLSDVEIVEIMELQKTLSPYACAAKTLVRRKTRGEVLITVGRD